MATIAYDKPIRDFIAGLDATGHVTHTAFRKTSVTFHHNDGRHSLQDILDVWTVRPASAHFQVDGAGAIGQYVRVNEYAWATGNTEGNKSSISIEMANATLSPNWTVAEVTWQEAARLAGWLFARVIGEAPTRDTVHVHHDWKATACAGPFIDTIREQLFQSVLAAYNAQISARELMEGDDMPSKEEFIDWVREGVISAGIARSSGGIGPADLDRFVMRIADDTSIGREHAAEARRMLGVMLGVRAPANDREKAALAKLAGGTPVDFDEAAVAAAVVDALQGSLSRLSDADIERIKDATADEVARRARRAAPPPRPAPAGETVVPTP